MSSPGIRPRNNQPAASGKKGSQQTLRVLSANGAARAARPSIAMPARRELTELLAGDRLLCLRRRASATATGPSAEVGQGTPADNARPNVGSPRAQSDEADLGR